VLCLECVAAGRVRSRIGLAAGLASSDDRFGLAKPWSRRPLPLNGSPQADPGYLRDLLVNVAEYVEPPSLVERAVNSGMVDSLASGSATMQSIQQGILSLANPPKFVEAAGYNPLPFEQTAGVHFAYEVLFGFFPNDGVVEVQSAQSQSFAHTILIAGEFPDDHLQLECDDPSILSFVGKYMTQ